MGAFVVALYEDNGDQAAKPGSPVQAEVVETLQWCMQLLAHQDEAGAALHTMHVRYSPLTFAVAEALHTVLEYQPLIYWPPGTQELVDKVLSHRGMHDSPQPPWLT